MSLAGSAGQFHCFSAGRYDKIIPVNFDALIMGIVSSRLMQIPLGRGSVGVHNLFRRFILLLAVTGILHLIIGKAGQEACSASHSMGNNAAGSPASDGTGSVGSPATDMTGSATSRSTGSMTSGITSSITTSVTTSLPSGHVSRPSGTHVTLSPYAEEISRILKFDRQVIIMIKEETHERIQRLVGYDENGYQIIAPGIAVTVPEDKADSMLASLRRKLTPLKYMAFIIEMNAGLKADKIGFLKGTDQYEILRIMHTDGDEYDISNRDVIDRLQEWEKIASFDIIGADNDWVEIEFKRLPKDLKAFTKEVYEFSPDAVDEGPGTIEGLIRDITRTKRLLLLWD